ncbi:hypothetical protein [Pseudoalteromonas sp. MMG024]|uniref:hypothetical protein n=1 Tax=Pseudoalteromonas sp. MMG024 TaxID=2909980 RepID=UPI001F4072EF|nr:hypothetical protein [Pseudoalteromonas sp. MMG024]MCF6456173.1 hypothetical protein [Pseudoalteromonas sp. MMG024]
MAIRVVGICHWLELIRQRLFGVYTALSFIYLEYYTTIALPCLNAKQTAAEIDRKGQHALVCQDNDCN